MRFKLVQRDHMPRDTRHYGSIESMGRARNYLEWMHTHQPVNTYTISGLTERYITVPHD